MIAVDTLYTHLYAVEINEREALTVHVFENAKFDVSDPIFFEALTLENGDTLRAIARIIVLASYSEVVSINDVYTNGNRGLDVGIRYNSPDFPFYSFIRYYLVNGSFVAFTWTGDEPALRNVFNTRRQGSESTSNKDIFFNSIRF